MFGRRMRIAFGGTLVGFGVLVGIGGAARATQNPSGCTENDFVLDLAKDKTIVHAGDLITYTVSTGNPNTSGNGCDVDLSSLSVKTPDGVVHPLNLGPGAGNTGAYPIGTAVTVVSTISYTASAADQTAGALDASATVTGAVHDDPIQDDALNITKSVSTSMAIPCITVTKTCTDAPAPGQPIQFSGTVTNCGAAAPRDNLSNVTVVDDHAGTVLTVALLAAGASANYSGSYVPGSSPSTDTVTATGTDVLGLTVTNTASATCRILTAPDIAVTKTCTDAPAPGQPIQFAGTVTNTGDVTLNNVTCSDNQVGVVLTLPSLAPGASAKYNGSYVPSGSPSTDSVTCTATDAINGDTVSNSASATCKVLTPTPTATPPATPSPTPTGTPAALGCRITNGGRLAGTETFPVVNYATHGGQVGASIGVATAFTPDSACIQGEWEDVRHGSSVDGNFHASSFDSLMCACLACDSSASSGAAGGLCDDVCGPQPPAAPANKICFSGPGDFTLTSGMKTARSVVFRVDAEDHGEPGRNDRYRIRIWFVAPDSPAGLALRQAVACANPLTEVVNTGLAPDIDDGGFLQTGNEQIHTSIGHTCP